MRQALKNIAINIENCQLVQRVGTVSKIYGLVVESTGPDAFLGEECEIYNKNYGSKIRAEVVALKDGRVLLMPYGDLRGVSLGNEVVATGISVSVPVGDGLLGRVLDGFGNPLDGMPKPDCKYQYPLYSEPLNPLARQKIDQILQTGVRVIDSMLTVGRGQRVGIFSGSGVGKSTLVGMIARHTDADINVIALVGERGREVMDFIDNCLGKNGLQKSVIIVATSDQPALTRVHAALAATTIAEYFRDQGKHVVLTMDSITRYAMALREIGLAVGEPPTSRGYTPSVFANLPKLMERCGTANSGGSITAFYSVLIEGDDINDPIGDSVRAILDGHIVLDRNLANRQIFPPIDILSSSSRLMKELVTDSESNLIGGLKRSCSVHKTSKDMLELGMYKKGANPELDRAVEIVPKLQDYFSQDLNTASTRDEVFEQLKLISGA